MEAKKKQPEVCTGVAVELVFHLQFLTILWAQSELEEFFPLYWEFDLPATTDIQGLRLGRLVLLLHICTKDSALLSPNKIV